MNPAAAKRRAAGNQQRRHALTYQGRVLTRGVRLAQRHGEHPPGVPASVRQTP